MTKVRFADAPPSAPIGVFDSGIGGLTVVAALRRLMPEEQIIYLGDTARLPYGTKSAGVVRRYTAHCARFLQEQGAKMIVIACNTATAYGLEPLQQTLGMPVVGVIEPSAAAAVQATRSGRIGVIGTEGTISSGSYQNAMAAMRASLHVTVAACPLFVPLAEEGLTQHPATMLLAQEYLAPLIANNIDTLVLGCTHYPLLTRCFEQVVGPGVHIVDSATAAALMVRQTLEAVALCCQARSGDDLFFATDVNQRVLRVAEAFLGAPVGNVELVDIAMN